MRNALYAVCTKDVRSADNTKVGKIGDSITQKVKEVLFRQFSKIAMTVRIILVDIGGQCMYDTGFLVPIVIICTVVNIRCKQELPVCIGHGRFDGKDIVCQIAVKGKHGLGRKICLGFITAVINQLHTGTFNQPGKDTILYICPGFPAHGRQPDVLGIKNVIFDIYEYRAGRLREKLEEFMSKGNIAAILYSNPNNPAWICLTEEELQIIGECANKYDVVVLEDMAYLCMDFRKDMSRPFEPPFQPTVARYTDNYVITLSASKIFSYAGERIAVAVISDKLYHREYPELRRRYGIGGFGDNYILTYLYVASSGTSHSAQYALAAMFKAAVEGRYNFVGELREYGRRSERSRDIFEKHGFHLVYDKDMDQTIGDGFFYTVGYGNLDNNSLMVRLMRCGINAIALNTTGSGQSGIRVCVSRLLTDEDFQALDERLQLFVELDKE